MQKVLNIGLIGHKFMGRAHSHAIKDAIMFFNDLNITPVMKTICGIGDDLPVLSERYGWEKYETDWHKVVSDPEIDVIDIAVPGFLHREIAIAAVNNKKSIFCEKPLARNFDEAKQMYDAVQKAGVIHMVNFNYRKVPAVQLAGKMIREGKLGEIVSHKGFYQQDWGLSGGPMSWRYESAKVGPGPLEMGIHITDLARYLVGEITEVASVMKTVVKERLVEGSGGKTAPVTNDDDTVWLAKFENGAFGVFEAARAHAGRKNFMWFEVNGTKGTIRFELERLNELNVFFNDDPEDRQGFKNIIVTEPVHPYMHNWWPSGHMLGWEHTVMHQYYDFLKAIENKTMPEPNFYDGMKAQQVLEAVVKSAGTNAWAKI